MRLSTPLACGALYHTAAESEDILPGLELSANAAVPHVGQALIKADLQLEPGWNGDAISASDFHRHHR